MRLLAVAIAAITVMLLPVKLAAISVVAITATPAIPVNSGYLNLPLTIMRSPALATVAITVIFPRGKTAIIY